MAAKHRKIIWIAALLLISAGIWLFGRWLQQQVEEKIHNAIPGQKIEFSSVEISVLHSSISVKDISFSLQPRAGNKHGIYFNSVRLKGIHFWQWISQKKLLIDSLSITGGQVRLDQPLTDFINKQIASARLSLENIPVQYFSVNISSIIYSKGLYQYKLAGINAAANKGIVNLTADTIRILPLYSRETFNRKLGHQADRIESTISGVSLTNATTSLLFKHELSAKELSVNNIIVYVFRDRRLPRESDIQPLPVGMIKKIPLAVRLNVLRVLNGTITYEEYPKDGDHTGILKVEHAKFSLSPFISHPLHTDPSHMTLRLEGSLMGSGTIFTSMSLPMHTDNYFVKGAIHNLDLTKLNSGAENLGKIHIESGLLDSLGFEFSFNDKRSTGKIIGIYHRLIIQPLKKNKKPAKIKSFMLRTFIIPLNKDRSLAEKKRTGKIDYTRDPTRKVSFYLLQSLLAGIKSSFKLGFLLPK